MWYRSASCVYYISPVLVRLLSWWLASCLVMCCNQASGRRVSGERYYKRIAALTGQPLVDDRGEDVGRVRRGRGVADHRYCSAHPVDRRLACSLGRGDWLRVVDPGHLRGLGDAAGDAVQEPHACSGPRVWHFDPVVHLERRFWPAFVYDPGDPVHRPAFSSCLCHCVTAARLS